MIPCGCSDKLDTDNKKFNNNKILSLDSMASMSIDEIINLYKDGYRLEGLMDKVDIVSLGCTGSPVLDVYNPVTQQGGTIIYRGTVGACKITPTSRCLDLIAFNARRYNTSYTLYFEIREHDSVTGLPKGTPGDSVGLIKEVNDTLDTVFPGYAQPITFQAELPAANVPYWITIRSSDYVCGGGTTGQERVEISLSTPISGTNRASYGPIVPCGWSTISNNDSWAIEVYKTTYTAPPVLNSIGITPTTASINMGSTQQFTASCLDQYGASIECPTLIWTSSSGFAPINSSGLVTGSGTGATYTSNISCTGGGKTSNTAVLTVVKVVYSITISPLTTSINVGATQQLTAVCRDSAGNPLSSCPTLTWYTTNSSIATVNSSGLVTAGSTPGTANISCTGGGANSTAPSVITVTGPLDTITISPPTASLNIGNTQQLTAVCRDSAGNPLSSCPTLIWSSDSANATVDSSGLVSAISGGTANISCSGGGKTSNLSVITINTLADIRATNITGTPSVPCTQGTCSVSISATWRNNGGTTGSFVPNISIDGTPVTPAQYPSQSLAPSESVTKTFTVTGLTVAGNPHSICPIPN